MIVVVDTNVIMKAIFRKEKWCREALLLEFHSQGDIRFAVSPKIHAEYIRVFHDLAGRVTSPSDVARMSGLFSNIIWRMAKFEIAKCTHYCTEDSNDNMFIDCVIASKAKYFITDNTQHFLGVAESVQKDHEVIFKVFGPYQFVQEINRLKHCMISLREKFGMIRNR